MEKPEDYIIKAANQKKEASRLLDQEIKKVNGGFDDLIKKATPKEQGQAMEAVSKAQSILEKVRAGGDIQSLVSELQKLRL